MWLGAPALRAVELEYLSALLGVSLLLYGTVSLAGWRWQAQARREIPVGLGAGVVNGVITGMTGSFVVPGVMYLQSLGLARDALIQAMGMLFLVSTVSLGLALGRASLLGGELLGLSALAVVPAVAGMVVGQRIRQRFSERVFRRVFFGSLVVLGGYILAASLWRAAA